MRKTTMKMMALLLTAVMMVSPASTAYAAVDMPVIDVIAETQEEVANAEVISEETTEETVVEEAVSEETVEDATVETDALEETEEETSVEEGMQETITEETISETELPEEGVKEPSLGEGVAEDLLEDDVETEMPMEEAELPEIESVEEIVVSVEEGDAAQVVSGNHASVGKMMVDAVSGNDVEAVFPGMPEEYELTAKQVTAKKMLAEHVDELEEFVEGTHYISGEVVLTTDSEEEAQMAAKAYGGTLESCFDGVAVIKLAEGVSVKSAVRAALCDEVKLPPVSPNYYRYEYTTDSGMVEEASYGVTDPFLAVNNSYYQWQHYAVGSMYAWSAGYTGAGVKVAVIDSGVAEKHEDVKAVYNYNAMTGAEGSADDTTSGHGTHVAGIIAANANSVGGRGIAPDAEIYNFKVFGEHSASGSSATTARAINKARTKGVDIMNMSLGGVGYTMSEYEAVQTAVNAGIAIFAAAGNDGSMTENFPAAFPEVICVAATDKSNGRASFSDYGKWVDLCGPGVNIYSSYPTSMESSIGVSGYDVMSGTSQATPVITGTAAVILSASPKALQGKTGKAKVAALEQLMKSGVTKATGQNIGKGIVNLPKVLKIPGVAAKPAKPTFGTKAGIIEASEVTTTISAAFDCDIYYSVDGKTPAFKNGVITNGIKAVANPETITVNGIVAGKATGKVTVKAIAVNKYTMTAGPVATVKYTLKPAVEKVTITGDTVQVVAGKSVKLKADVTPAYAANKKVEWKINANASAGVKINANNGKVTTTKTATPGTYQVTAKAKDGKGAADTYTITVMADAKVKSVAFKEAKVTLKVKTDTVAYKMADNLTALKVDDTPATAEDFVWTSSKQAVARVNRTTGEVTAVGAGSAVITAVAADGSGVKKTCTVVVEQLATAIAITQPVNTEDVEIVTLAAGKSAALKATVTPTTTKQKKLTWSIDAPASSGVTVNPSNGKVTAAANAKAGTYTVTATAVDGSDTADTIKVQVYTGVATGIRLDQSAVRIFRKATAYHAPTRAEIKVTTEGNGTYAKDYTVTSSNPNVVRTFKNGNVITVAATGKATGSATIKVVMNDGSRKSATCKVTVWNPVSKVLIAPESGRTEYLGEGNSVKLVAMFEEEFGKASAKAVKWSVLEGQSVVKVDEKTGKVTALQGLGADGYTGHAVIQAEVADGSGVKATYDIYTFETITSIELSDLKRTGNGAYVMNVSFNNRTWQQAGVYPEVNVELSNPAIASVDNSYAYGQFAVYLWAEGYVTITVKANDGSGVKAVKYIKII